MKIERWEDLPACRLRRASSPTYDPTKVHALTLQADGQIIPASKSYDTIPTSPALVPNGFTIDTQDLGNVRSVRGNRTPALGESLFLGYFLCFAPRPHSLLIRRSQVSSIVMEC